MNDDLARIEAKVDTLSDAVVRLILIEERQQNQAGRIQEVEAKIAAHASAFTALNAKVESWMNKFLGVGLALGAVYTLIKLGADILK
jgi:hypothetical protein